MISLFIKDSQWYVFRIPHAQVLNKDDTVTALQLDLKQGLFIATADNKHIHYALDNSGDALLILHLTHKVKFCAQAKPELSMDLDTTRLANLVIATYGEPKQLNTPSNSVGTNHKKPVVEIAPEERLRFVNMLKDVKIEGRYNPMDHQYDAAFFKAHHGKAFDLSTMRTGKTGSTMLALEYLFRTQQIRKVMILAPLSCVRPVWVDAIHVTMPRHIVKAVVGTKAQRLKAFDSNCDILCANFETLKLHPDKWREFKPDAIVIDECTHYANLKSQRSKAIMAFIADVQPSYVWGLTGTPGSDPLKAFAMSKLINPHAVACNTITAWQNLTQYRWGTEPWQWKNRDCAPRLIKEALSPAVLFRKDDLFDLPPVVYIARQVEATLQQTRTMNRLREDMRACADSGDTITAQQKSVLVSKLMQCACGAVYTDSGEIARLDNSTRVDEIMELISEAVGKTVIFNAFTATIKKLHEDLTARGIKCAVVDGSTSEKKRSEIFRAFQYEKKGHSSVDVLIAHPRTTAFGVELASADMMVFDGAPLSGDFVFGQAVERLSSLKQKAKQITIAQVYTCAEERKLFNALLDGQTQAQVVAGLFNFVAGVAK